MIRTFVSLEMNEDLQRRLAGVIQQVAQALPRIRWVDPASIHLTLAFLGELDDVQLEQAGQATAAAARQIEPFSYRLSRLGIFGPPQQPRVIWMGIEEKAGSLVRLHHSLNQELEQRKFVTEKRPFAPHLTLAHLKGPLSANELQTLQDLLKGPQPGIIALDEYLVQSVNVMKSELLRSGAHYTCLHSYALKQP